MPKYPKRDRFELAVKDFDRLPPTSSVVFATADVGYIDRARSEDTQVLN